jgi:hypothetical protein
MLISSLKFLDSYKIQVDAILCNDQCSTKAIIEGVKLKNSDFQISKTISATECDITLLLILLI